ncbi:YhaN family protein [Loktanella sp. SALINAS62]|uniref:YhaN family protein n=1 Tax=Loktanella sp. SALINAS62 TaxID=2706124 RepID=UPI001B8B5080|nr:YhaN family protein [Loktanella sp. SALINAS62]MBS1301144.1 AAA family ATPase [Loktanella sp. SALINAS62]
MRLRSLMLERFGHFTDRTYDFGDAAGRPDFHIVYGPNEAGKTTTMEAALRLFYGFPKRDGYGFRHQHDNLQVTALLETDGQITKLTRVAQAKSSLLDAAGHVLPETALSQHLAGLSLDDYRNLLCLDDETIERGGDDIAQAKGDIGRLLFSAAAGVADLSTVLDKVKTDADAIYRKRRSTTRVAELKRALIDVERAIRDLDTTASAWRGLKKSLADAQQAEAEARQNRDGLHDDAARVAAEQRVLPMLGRIDLLDTRIAPFSNYPARLDFDPETLVDMLAQHTRLDADVARLTAEIAAVTTALDELGPVSDPSDLTAQLDALDGLRSRDATATQDIDRRRTQAQDALRAMVQAARDLGAADGVDPQALVIDAESIETLDQTRQVLRACRDAAAVAAQEVTDLSDRRDAAQSAVDAMIARALPMQGIGAILSRYDVDRLAPAVLRAQDAIAGAVTAADAARDALGCGATLPPCPTTQAQAQAWVARDASLETQTEQTTATLSQHREDIAARAAQAAQLVGSSGLLRDADLRDLTDRRDRFWTQHRQALDADSADQFADAMQAVDAALRRQVAQAGDLGQLRQVEQSHAEATARADATEARLAALQADRASLQDAIDAVARQVGFPAGQTATGWLDWVQAHATAQAARDALARLRDQHAPTLDKADALMADLAPHLDLVAPTFDGALDVARRLAGAERDAQNALDQARASLHALNGDLARRNARAATVQAERDAADKRWCDLIDDLFGQALSPDRLMTSLAALRSLRAQEDRRAEAAGRVDKMVADQTQFGAAINALAETCGIGCGDTAAATFARLRQRADADRALAEKAARDTDRLTAARAELAHQQDAQAQLDSRRQAMAGLFPSGVPTNTLDDLRQSAMAAAQVIADRAERADLIAKVTAELAEPDLTSARARLSDATAAALDARANRTADALKQAEQDVTRAVETRVAGQAALAQVTASAEVAQLTEQRATLELELEAAILDHLELSLGHTLAEEAIRRYRDSHRSAMMSATERCFAMLTDGAYARLATKADGASETLLAIAADGTTKGVLDMSKGTRFQLYLALRAAAHEQMVAQGTRLPFFCDDIFETFDETRTSAACRVMEQIGRSGQAIYLTHHRHVVDLARKVCDTPPMVHEI